MQKISILNIVLGALLIIGFTISLPLQYLFFIVFIYLLIIVYASANIRSGFFLKAFNSIPESTTKTICLTFDDGPDETYTIKILEIMEEFGWKASFFVIGSKIKGREEILKKIDRDGHLIGNHSYSHSNFFTIKGTKEVILELENTSAKIEELIGKYPQTFRPPFGVTNPNIARAVQKLKFNVLGWNIRSLDTLASSREIVLQRVIRKCRPGSVVLFHDNIPDTVMILRNFLTFLKQNDYEVILPDSMFNFDWYKKIK